MLNIKKLVLEAGYSTVPAYWLSDENPVACSTSNFERLVAFAEALIESYKAELLKEVGEPVGYHYLPNNEMFPVEEVSRSNLKNNPQYYVFLYTSDQLAAAQEETESSEAVEFDVEAVAWAYGKCVALGLENGSMESAMMMDRLKMMLGGY